MPASNELPRGWNFTQRAAGIATINIPAIQGVSHVLTSVKATISLQTGAPPIRQTVWDQNAFPYLEVTIPSASPAWTAVTDEWTGQIVYPVGGPLSIGFDGSSANLIELLVIQGYDI